MSYSEIHLGYNTAASVIVAVVFINEAGFEISCYGQLRVLINRKAQSKARALFLWLRDICGYRWEASTLVGHIIGRPEWGWPLTFTSCLKETGVWWSLTGRMCFFSEGVYDRTEEQDSGRNLLGKHKGSSIPNSMLKIHLKEWDYFQV